MLFIGNPFCIFAAMESNRLKKVTAQLQQDLAVVLREIAQSKFAGTLITVSNVKISHDLGFARIHLSIFPTNKDTEVMEWVQSEKSLIKDKVVRKLKGQLRIMPDLQFFLDDSLDYNDEIDRLIKGQGESPIS